MNEIIIILPPIKDSTLRRDWTAVIGGSEVSGDTEAEARQRALALILADPLVAPLVEALRHQVQRNHDYSPAGCSGCEVAKKILAP